jgi:hypothetical protein
MSRFHNNNSRHHHHHQNNNSNNSNNVISIPEFMDRYYNALINSASICDSLPAFEKACLVEILKCLNRKNLLMTGIQIDGRIITSRQSVTEWLIKNPSSRFEGRHSTNVLDGLLRNHSNIVATSTSHGNIKFTDEFFQSVKDQRLLITPDVNLRDQNFEIILNAAVASKAALTKNNNNNSDTNETSIPAFYTRFFEALIASSRMTDNLPKDEQIFLIEFLKCLNRKHRPPIGASIERKSVTFVSLMEWAPRNLTFEGRTPEVIYNSLFRRNILTQYTAHRDVLAVALSPEFVESVVDQRFFLTPDVNLRDKSLETVLTDAASQNRREGGEPNASSSVTANNNNNNNNANPYSFKESEFNKPTSSRAGDSSSRHQHQHHHHSSSKEGISTRSSHRHHHHHHEDSAEPRKPLSTSEFLDIKYNELIFACRWSRSVLTNPDHVRFLIEVLKIIVHINRLAPGTPFGSYDVSKCELVTELIKIGVCLDAQEANSKVSFLDENQFLYVFTSKKDGSKRVALHKNFCADVPRHMLVTPTSTDRFSAGSVQHHEDRREMRNKHVALRDRVAHKYERSREGGDGKNPKYFNDNSDEYEEKEGGRRRGRSEDSSRGSSVRRDNNNNQHYNNQIVPREQLQHQHEFDSLLVGTSDDDNSNNNNHSQYHAQTRLSPETVPQQQQRKQQFRVVPLSSVVVQPGVSLLCIPPPMMVKDGIVMQRKTFNNILRSPPPFFAFASN